MKLNNCKECEMLCCVKNPQRIQFFSALTLEVEKSIKNLRQDDSDLDYRTKIFNSGINVAHDVLEDYLHGRR